MAAPTDLHDIATALLAAAAASLDETSGATSAPDRRFVDFGTPVDDCCEQLVVHINPVVEKTTRINPAKSHSLAWLNEVTFTLLIGRCVPGIEMQGTKVVLPATADIDAAARIVLTDGWALWNGLHNRVAAGELFGSCASVVFGPLTAREPSGECAGWTLDIAAVVNGYAVA